MAYGTITFFSNVLGRDVNVDYLLPDTRRRYRSWTAWNDKKLPVIWILHGNGDSNNAWIRKSTIELYARQSDVAVIMPDCQRECYTNSKRGFDFFTFVADELVTVMRNYFPLSTKREDNYIIGNSMGGYGAMKCALTYPERYSAVASFSGALDYREALKGNDVIFGKNAPMIFGSLEEYEGSENDLYALLNKLKEKDCGEQLKVYQCCGTEDFLYGVNQEFRHALSETVGNYIYHEGPGGHDWFYWNPEIANVFQFFGLKEENEWNDSGMAKQKDK
ncbi:MAG: esterase family protein [Solobacterium sp.]|nr:esterase family protein [Solobacterium sp.]